VERVEIFKFLGVHITKDLSRSTHTMEDRSKRGGHNSVCTLVHMQILLNKTYLKQAITLCYYHGISY
jgi:hypothetical protein